MPFAVYDVKTRKRIPRKDQKDPNRKGQPVRWSKISLDKEINKVAKKVVAKTEEFKQYVAGLAVQVYFGTTAAADATYRALVTPIQGFGDNNREGDELRLRSLTLRISFFNNLGAGSNPTNYARLVIFQFLQSNAIAAPSMADMFINGAGAGNVNIYSSPNIDRKSIYRILYDKTIFTAGAQGASTSVAPNYAQHMVVRVPLKYAKKNIQFINATINSVNQIYFVVLGEQGSVANNPFYTADWNVRYTDS